MLIPTSIKRFQSLKLSKRKEFVLITIFLTLGIIATQILPEHVRYWLLFFLTVMTFGLFAVGLRENLSGVRWITLLILPTLFTASIGLFYFLLPVRWLTRLPIAVLFAVCTYALLLLENIFSVAVNRSIQLLRVAHVVGFLITIITMFMIVNVVFSLRLPMYANAVLVFFAVLLLSIQSLWSITLEDRLNKSVVLYSGGIALMLAQLGFVISFWPLRPIIISIFLATITYALIGISQQYFAKRLFKQNIVEYLQVVVIVTILIFITTRYR